MCIRKPQYLAEFDLNILGAKILPFSVLKPKAKPAYLHFIHKLIMEKIYP